jgi:hypothetical protein
MQKGMDGQSDFKFLNSENANIDATALADALQSHVAPLISAFDSLLTKIILQPTKLYERLKSICL